MVASSFGSRRVRRAAGSWLVVAFALVLVACTEVQEPSADGAMDATREATADVSADRAPEGSRDATPEATADAPADDALDAASDAATDAPSDAAADAPGDAAADAPGDADAAPPADGATDLPGLSCANPKALSAPSSTSVTLPAAPLAPLCDGAMVPTRFVRVTVPAGQKLVARARGAQLRAVATTCTAACIGTGDGELVLPAETGARSLVLAVSGAAGASFDLALETPAADATHCERAPLIASNGTWTMDPRLALEQAPVCDGTETAPAAAHFYELVVAAGSRVRLRADAARLRLLRNCDPAACVADVVRAAGDPSISWINTGASPVRLLAAASAASSLATSVRVEATFGAPSPAGRCTTAPALVDGVTVTNLSAAQSDQTDRGCSDSTPPQRALWYTAVVPPMRRLRIHTTGEGAETMQVAIRAGCDAQACLPAATLHLAAREWETAWDNRSDSPRTVYVVVRGGQTPFDLTAHLGTIPDSATCATAPLVSAASAATTVPFTDAGDAVSRCGRAPQPAVLYRVRVPAGQRFEARATTALTDGSNDWMPHLRVLAGCDALECLADMAAPSRPTRVVRWTNDATSEREVFLAVSPGEEASSSVEGPAVASFDLAMAFETAPTNATCGGATLLAPESTMSGRLVDAWGYAPMCSDDLHEARALFYAVEVPDGQKLTVNVEDLAHLVGVRLLADCAATTCLGERPSATQASWQNSTGEAQRIFVAVTGDAADDGLFSLSATLEATSPPPSNP